MSAEGGTKAVVAALLANLGIAVTKFLAFALTGFSSMLAEAIHSVADSFNQLLLLLGGRRARRAATPEHPFGYGRERYVYAFLVSIVLFSVGGLFALYEAYHKWHEARGGQSEDPFASRWWWVPLAVLIVSVAMEGMSLRTAAREGSKAKGARSWVAYVRSAKAPELPVVLLEDFAALIGLTFALLGVGLTLLTRRAEWDAVGTASIGVLLVVVAGTLAIEMKSLLLGESATREHQARIAAALIAPEAIDRVIHVRTLHLGPEELLVAAKVAVLGTRSAGEVADAIDEAERSTRAAVPELTLVMYLEPDIDRGTTHGEPAAGGTGAEIPRRGP